MKHYITVFFSLFVCAILFLSGCQNHKNGSSVFVSSTNESYDSHITSSASSGLSDISSASTDTPDETSSSFSSTVSVTPHESSEDVPQHHHEKTSDFLSNKYFVSKLSSNAFEHFALLYHAAVSCEKQVSFSDPIPEEELDLLMWLLNYDCPELIHLTGDYYPEYSPSEAEKNTISGLSFQYCMDRKSYQKCTKELDEYLDDLKRTTQGMNDYQKELYIYQTIFKDLVFDDYAPHAGSIYGALIDHSARCEGISKAFAWCMQGCGMECLTIVGTPLWENSSAYSSHSWNIALVDGNYYHVDLAADNLPSLRDEKTSPLFGFFNSDDEQVSRTHLIHSIFNELGVPACSSKLLNYHIYNHLYIDSQTDIQQQFFGILKEHYQKNSETTLSIRMENEAAYHRFIENCSDWFSRFLTEYDLPECYDELVFNDVSLTCILTIRPADSL